MFQEFCHECSGHDDEHAAFENIEALRRRPSKRKLNAANTGRWLFVQNEFGSLHPAIAVKPALHYVAAKNVGHGEKTHSLMMNHPSVHHLNAGRTKSPAGIAVIGGFVESVWPEPAQSIHAPQ